MLQNKRECKTANPLNTVNEKDPDMDHLSHELRTPLHAIQGGIEILKPLPTSLCRLKKELTSFFTADLIIKDLDQQAQFLKSEVEIIQKSLIQLNLFFKKENVSQFDKMTQKLKIKKGLVIRFSKQLSTCLKNLQRSVTLLIASECALQLLIQKSTGLDKKELTHQIEKITKEIIENLMQAEKDSQAFNNTVGHVLNPSVIEKPEEMPCSEVPSFFIKALIVDDNLINQKILANFLKKKNHTFEIASDGAEAVKKFSLEKFAIVFMDIQMPIMDGFEATREIRTLEEKEQSHSKTIIIALTAMAPTSENQAKFKDAGMDGFIFKPFSPTQIYSVINKYIVKEIALLSSGVSSKVLGTSPFPSLLDPFNTMTHGKMDKRALKCDLSPPSPPSLLLPSTTYVPLSFLNDPSLCHRTAVLTKDIFSGVKTVPNLSSQSSSRTVLRSLQCDARSHSKNFLKGLTHLTLDPPTHSFPVPSKKSVLLERCQARTSIAKNKLPLPLEKKTDKMFTTLRPDENIRTPSSLLYSNIYLTPLSKKIKRGPEGPSVLSFSVHPKQKKVHKILSPTTCRKLFP